MKKQIISVMIVSALCFSFLSLSAQDKSDKPTSKTEKKPAHMGQKMMQDKLGMLHGLKLTDDQKQKIEQLSLDNRKEIIKINGEIQLNRVDLKQLFTEKELNTAKLTSLTEAIGKLELQIKSLRTQNWIAIYNLLDNDQKAIWKKHFEKEVMMKPALGGNMMQRGMGMHGMKAEMAMRPGRMQGHMSHPSIQKDSTVIKKK